MTKPRKRAGFVAILGRPNVGKSTLLNAILGDKISIATPKAQTTQHQIIGIKTYPHAQMVYLDTPGIHQKHAQQSLNRQLNQTAWASLRDADLVLWLIEANRWTDEDQIILAQLKKFTLSKPVVLVLNKIDKLKIKQDLLPILEKRHQDYPFHAMIPICAENQEGLQELEDYVLSCMPESDYYFYPEDANTVQTEKFRMAEMIREKLMLFLGDELPYVIAVQIEKIDREKKIPWVHAIIWVERETQKNMVIGHKGELLKKIGTAARHDIEKFLKSQVMLKLWVKVKAEWRENSDFLNLLGF